MKKYAPMASLQAPDGDIALNWEQHQRDSLRGCSVDGG